MEPQFQTSFIPKKMSSPIGMSVGGPKKHTGTSLLMLLGVVVFLGSLATAGGGYAWKHYLQNQQVKYSDDLAAREEHFPIKDIELLKEANVKIDTAKTILSKHIATSKIFGIISQLTTENVRFLSLDLTTPTDQQNDGIKITLRGYGTNFPAIAFQSDVLGHLQDYNLRQTVINPILSDPSRDVNGTVSFGFTATIDPPSLLYQKNFTTPVTDLEPATP